MSIKTDMKIKLAALKTKIISKYMRWGLDSDNDLVLKVFCVYFCFYKWSTPTITFNINDFKPFDDTTSKSYYKPIRELIYKIRKEIY